jgi:hypothetical protein
MGPQPVGKVPDLRRPAGRAAPHSMVPGSWPWAFLGFCLPAAVADFPAVHLLHTRARAGVAGVRRPAREPAGLWQAITFGQPPGTTAGLRVPWTASSATTTSPPGRTGPGAPFRLGTAALCAVAGSIAAPTAPGFCVLTAAGGGTVNTGAEGRTVDSVPGSAGKRRPAVLRGYGQNRLGPAGPSSRESREEG